MLTLPLSEFFMSLPFQVGVGELESPMYTLAGQARLIDGRV